MDANWKWLCRITAWERVCARESIIITSHFFVPNTCSEISYSLALFHLRESAVNCVPVRARASVCVFFMWSFYRAYSPWFMVFCLTAARTCIITSTFNTTFEIKWSNIITAWVWVMHSLIESQIKYRISLISFRIFRIVVVVFDAFTPPCRCFRWHNDRCFRMEYGTCGILIISSFFLRLFLVLIDQILKCQFFSFGEGQFYAVNFCISFVMTRMQAANVLCDLCDNKHMVNLNESTRRE